MNYLRAATSQHSQSPLTQHSQSPLTFKKALDLGHDKEALDIYLAENEATRQTYLLYNSHNRIFCACCRHATGYSLEKRDVLLEMMAQLLISNPQFARRDLRTMKSPLEDLIESGVDIDYFMSFIPLNEREVITLQHRDAYGALYYGEMDRGELIFLLSVPGFWENVIDSCLRGKTEADEESNTIAPFYFLHLNLMTAFAYYINAWVRDYKEGPKPGYDIIFNKILTAVHEFTTEQKVAFFQDLEEPIKDFIILKYRAQYKNEMQNKIEHLHRQCSTIFNMPNAMPAPRQIHTFKTEELHEAALNCRLTPNQRLVALNRLTKTARFKQLAPEERIIYFTGICNAASDQIESIRQLVTAIRNEISLPCDALEETAKELLKIPPLLFALIEKTKKEASKHLVVFSSEQRIFKEITEARQTKSQWDTLYDAIKFYFNSEVSKIETMNLDYDDLFAFVYIHHQCKAEGTEIINLFKNLEIKTLDALVTKVNATVIAIN